ncbi:MAG: T9SS type A sorting domain-containing protein [Flavobacteriales bacterium]|nr:T9SS type A sorting domain-containing protein [Flavobacteriales bacterium]
MKTFTDITKMTGLIGPLVALLLMPAVSQSAVFTATSSGSWSSSATWGGIAPGNNITLDQIIIPAGIQVIMDADVMVNGALSSVQVDGALQGGAYVLTVVNGTVTGIGQMVVSQLVLGASASMAFSGSVSAGSLVNNGAALALAAAATIEDELQLNGGAVIIGSGSLALASGTQIIVNGGSISLNGGVFLATQGYTVVYQGSSTSMGIEVSGAGLSGIEIALANPSQQISLSGDLTLDGDLTINQGVLVIGNNSLTVNGILDVSGAGSLSVSGSSELYVTASGIGTTDLNFGSGSSTIGTLSVDLGGSGQAQFQGDLTVQDSFSLQGGQLNLGSSSALTLNGQAAFGAGAQLGGNGSADLTIATAGSVNGSVSFAGGSATIGDLTIAIDNGGSVSLGSDLGVSGTLGLQSGFIALGAGDLSVNGTVSGGSSSSYVVTSGQGSLMLDVDAGASGSFYPVGTDVHFSPVTLAQAAGSASGMFGVSAMAGVLAYGSTGVNMADFTSVVNTSWMVMAEASASADIDLTMTVEWAAQQAVNSFNAGQAYISHYVNSAWDVSAGAEATVNAEGRFELSREGISSLSPFAVFDNNTAVGIEARETISFSFYPNPTVDVVNYTLTGNSGATHIQLFDATGKLIMARSEAGSRGTIDLQGLPIGIYTVRIIDSEQTRIERIVRQ